MTGARWIGLVAAAALLAAFAAWAHRALRVVRLERAELRWQAPPDALPAEREREGFREERWALSDGTRQRAFYLPSRDGTILVVAHGSPGTALGMLPQARALARSGRGLLLVDLPGYGGSEGDRTWGARYQEAIRRAVDFAASRPGTIALGGLAYSMSTAVMARAAADDARIRALVLLAPFPDLPTQRAHERGARLPGMGAVAILTARALGVAVDELETTAALRRLRDRPLLFVAGERDRAVPAAVVVALQTDAPHAEIEIVAGADHVDLASRSDAAMLGPIEAFLAAHLRGSSATP